MADRRQQGGTLYAGSDLINAAERSAVNRSMMDRYAGIVNGLGIFTDAIRHRQYRSDNRQFQLVIAEGLVRGTSNIVSIAYAGQGANRNWCFDSAISERNVVKTLQYSSAEETIDSLHKAMGDVDIVFVDDLGDDLVARLKTGFVQIPAWVKQRVRLADDWNLQMQMIGRKQRQEVSRTLRKYGYECKITCDSADMSYFYEQLYRPYVSSIYGETAIIVDRDRFIRECQRGVQLQLVQNDTVVAAALLRPIGRAMAIVWTGMDPGAELKRIPGGTDALDYFSLLYAHLKGYRWLDLGPSRADLYDGTLRYKCKWGAEIVAGHFKQPSIYWTCTGRNDSVQKFLGRHAFISNKNGRLTVIAFLSTDECEEPLQKRLERLVTPGVSRYRVISISPSPAPLEKDLRDIDPNFSLIEAKSVTDAMRLAS